MWIKLESLQELDKIKTESFEKPVVIFKHSTRCSISAAAVDRLERSWNDEELDRVSPYFLDLIAFRPVSNKIAEEFSIEHQSPQVLIIKDGSCVYHNSHMGISYGDLKRQVEKVLSQA
jgi:bacillithiol system protein YtxJ